MNDIIQEKANNTDQNEIFQEEEIQDENLSNDKSTSSYSSKIG